jgi:hypothetical protein
MADKYKAISNLEQMRELGRVRKAGEAHEKNIPKSSTVLTQRAKEVKDSSRLSHAVLPPTS